LDLFHQPEDKHMKQLLVDFIPFDITPQMLTEARANPNAPLVLSGPLQKAGEKNHNGRVYPKEVLAKEIEKYQQVIRERRALGELDHPDSSVINLKNVSHNVLECHWEGDTVVGKIELLTTPSGNIARDLIKNNIRIGISSRGLGSVRQMNENTVEVQDDFELLCFDLVSSPSTRGAYMNPTSINESVNRGKVIASVAANDINKYFKIENIIRDIR
jgi:hypothetical protein